MDTKGIGQQIKKARISAGLTQKELAEKLGIPYQGIGQWERGVRTPKIETLRRIAKALHVEFLDLLPEDGKEDYINAYFQQRAEETAKGIPDKYAWEGPPPSASESRRSRLLAVYDHVLNEAGQVEAEKRVQELSELPRYRKPRWNTETPPEAK